MAGSAQPATPEAAARAAVNPADSPLEGMSALPHLGVIRAQGEEAAKFLQGQLTHDVVMLPAGRARLAGYCSPKGRLLASFIVVRLGDGDFALIVSKDVLAPTLKRLSMFVLRAKVTLTDATDAFVLHGLAGAPARAALGGGVTAPWDDQTSGADHTVCLYPADGVTRALQLAPASAPPAVATPLPAAALSPALWAWSEVRSGVAMITAPTAEAFVPQMLNYESVDGVSFKKGCYPGQEVVARSQFRGQIKRRAMRATATGPLMAGQEVFDLQQPDQPCGMVAAAAMGPHGDYAAIVSAPPAALEGGHGLQTGDGQRLRLESAPYPLLLDL